MKKISLGRVLLLVITCITLGGCACGQQKMMAEAAPPPPPPVVRQAPPPAPAPVLPLKEDRG